MLPLLSQIFYNSERQLCVWKKRERTRERQRARKWKRVRVWDRNSWGCVGRALTTGMHEEAASIPKASGWFRDTTERTAQQPTCKSRWPSTPSAILGLSLPLWWLSLSNHTNKAWKRKTWEIGAWGEEGRRCIVYCLCCFFITSCHRMVCELIYRTAASPRQRHPAAVYNMLAIETPALLLER